MAIVAPSSADEIALVEEETAAELELEQEREEDLSGAGDYSITSYGADYPVDALVKRMRNGDIFVPKFQRKYVWSPAKASRFIESLLMGLPVPAIFLSKDPDDQRLLVIDGQQRLNSLRLFYDGYFDPEAKRNSFALEGVSKRFRGMTYATLSDEDRRRLDDSLIHAIIVKQDDPAPGSEQTSSPSSVYHLFERLNTGGILLHPQEIRACIFQGALTDLLTSLNSLPTWRTLFGKAHLHMKDEEAILRFFALYENADQYTKPMSEFLNRYAQRNRRLSDREANNWRKQFTETVETVLHKLGPTALRPVRVFNAAFCDAVLVGVANRLRKGPTVASDTVWKKAFEALKADQVFKEAYTTGTTQADKVNARLAKAIAAFGKLK